MTQLGGNDDTIRDIAAMMDMHMAASGYHMQCALTISDGRYDTKCIDTTDTILSKLSIDITNFSSDTDTIT